MAPLDRNSDRRGIKEMREERQGSIMLDITWFVQIVVPM